MAMRCRECKGKISSTLTACPHCGRKLAPQKASGVRWKLVATLSGVGFVAMTLAMLCGGEPVAKQRKQFDRHTTQPVSPPSAGASQCDKYSSVIVNRIHECSSGHSTDSAFHVGVCERNQALTPTDACLDVLRRAPCDVIRNGWLQYSKVCNRYVD